MCSLVHWSSACPWSTAASHGHPRAHGSPRAHLPSESSGVICQETKEWTAIHDRKNALASLANLEMKTLQTRNITQPRILKILDVYTYARFKRTPMGKLGRRDQTQPPRVRNLSFCNTRRWLGPDRYLLRISLYFRCASCPDLTVRRRCRAASCVSILTRFQLADSQWLFRAF